MAKTATTKQAGFETGTKTSAYFVDPKELVVIGLDTDHKSEAEHPLYDPRVKLKLDDHMVANVMRYGVLETVIVRRNGEKYEVVAGRQRVRWARAANEKLIAEGKEPIKVPTMLKRGDDAEMYGVLISENEIRQGDDALTQARKMERFLAMGRSEEEAAVAFGVSVSTIKGRMKILEMSTMTQKAVAKGEIAIHEALAFAKLSHDDQDKAIEEHKKAHAEGRRASKPKGAGKTHGDKATKTQILAVARHLSGTAQMALLWAVGEIEEKAASEDKKFAGALAKSREKK